eukprot:366434-Chlamydomonas_euryale.AAC.5
MRGWRACARARLRIHQSRPAHGMDCLGRVSTNDTLHACVEAADCRCKPTPGLPGLAHTWAVQASPHLDCQARPTPGLPS